jgi:hypothetical protein
MNDDTTQQDEQQTRGVSGADENRALPAAIEQDEQP